MANQRASRDLRLTPFEEYMLLDDRARWPMTFFFKVTLHGCLDHATWERAIAEAVVRHPLLNSLLIGDAATGYFWSEPSPAIPPTVRWDGLQGPPTFAEGRTLDLRRQPGLRVWVQGQCDLHTVWFEFHHSCCDGVGAVQFITDCLDAYGAASGAPPKPSRPLLRDRLQDRGKFGLSFLWRILRLPLDLLAQLGVFEFFAHRPVSLVTADDQSCIDAQQTVGPSSFMHRFNIDDSARLRQAARAQGVTFNDLLVGSLFAALHDWFSQFAPDAFGKIFRVMIPMNLRLTADEKPPAANIVCMINLDRRMTQQTQPEKLLKLLSWEMWAAKVMRLGVMFHYILGLARRWGRIDRLLPTDRCLSTCLVTNLGQPLGNSAQPRSWTTQQGTLVLEGLEVLPPTRPMTPATFGVLTYAGRTTISMRYDAALEASRAEQLMALLVRRLEQHLTRAS